MALMPEMVNTRKIALAAEYGATAEDVIADSFTEEWFETLDRPIRPDARADRVRIEYPPLAQGDRVLYRVFWLEEDRARAEAAIMEDWYETIGPEAARDMQLLALG